MKITKLIDVGTVIQAVIFLIDYIYELFQINEISVVIRMTSLKTSTVIVKEEEELNTHFSFTFQAFFIHFVFIALSNLFGFFVEISIGILYLSSNDSHRCYSTVS